MAKFFTFGFIGFAAAIFSYSGLSAQDNTSGTVVKTVKSNLKAKQGDKAFKKLQFTKAVGLYKESLQSPTDTLHVVERLADSYRLMGDRPNAEQWYAKVVDNPKSAAIDKYYYAELLRADQNFSEAKKYYLAYANASQNHAGITAALGNLGNLPAANANAYKVEALGINSPQSDFAPAFYKGGKIIFTSNRSCNMASYDKWSANSHARIYEAMPDSAQSVTELKTHACGKRFSSSEAIYLTGNEIIFSAGKTKKAHSILKDGRLLPVMGLYSATITDGKISNIAALPLNAEDYSNSHPTISKDGKTLYFVSDRLGGQGGTDIYSSTLLSNGTWSSPTNLGPDLNTPFDEKFPFIADDGTLYFTSNMPNGYGGLDIYKSHTIQGIWMKPENLGAPINSADDDFSLIIDPATNSGYFASNRAGGKGADDLYRFTVNQAAMDYKVTVRVIDEATSAPLAGATLAMDCRMPSDENSLTDTSGQKDFTIKGGNTCTINVLMPGYKDGLAEITPSNNGGTIIVPMKADAAKLAITFKEEGTLLPIKNTVVSLSAANSTTPVNYTTDDAGLLSARITPGTYKITIADYPAVNEQISTSDAGPTGVVTKQILIRRDNMEVNVPLTGSGFTSAVTLTDLKNGNQNMVSPNLDGQLHLNLKMQRKYTIGYNGQVDTISTARLRPNSQVGNNWKFTVGQMWVIPNIYYDLNKWNIRKDAAAELDKLVKIMKDNPELEIEMSSHTDCRSSMRYNVVLSARRAKSVVDYLVHHGIKMKRIIAVGYGESMISNGCVCEPSNYSSCDEAQHQANRRTEVKVLKY